MTPSDFKLAFPEFQSMADQDIQFWIDRVAPHFDVERWDDLYEEGVGNLVAHYITVSKQQTAKAQANDPNADAVVLKAGDTEVRFSERIKVLQIERSPLVRTDYGQQYAYLSRLVGRGAISI